MEDFIRVNVSYDKVLTPTYTDEDGKIRSYEELRELRAAGVMVVYQYPMK